MSQLVFLDSNVLAKPFTRTLLWAGGLHSSYHVTWSITAEREASRHLRSSAIPIQALRLRLGQTLGPTGTDPNRFTSTEVSDRQLLADACAVGAQFLVTEDVDDYGETDLIAGHIAAVHPDLFLSVRLSPTGYLAGVRALSTGSSSPSRTPEQVHQQAGRLHPLLVAAMQARFPGVQVALPTHRPTAVQYRGAICLRCGGARLPTNSESVGTAPTCTNSCS